MRLSRFKSLFNFENKALVLMYHRINAPSSDPWNLSVSPDNFEGHLQILREHFSIISTNQLLEQLDRKKIENNCVSLTFDDGYQDNYITAKPLLEKYAVPATFFITDSNLKSRKPFWWDELEQIIVQAEHLPPVFSVAIREDKFSFDLKNETILTDELRAKQSEYKSKKPPTLRTQLYVKLWRILSALPKSRQDELLKLIREWAGLPKNVSGLDVCMSPDQLCSLSDHRLFTIGSHSTTHPLLNRHSIEIQFREITENRLFLENLTGKKINQFAYPSGKYAESTIKILKDNTFSAAFTTNPKPVTKKTDPYVINRFQVNNWDKEKFKRTINKWFIN